MLEDAIAIVVVVEVELVVDELPDANAIADDDATVLSTTTKNDLGNNFICVF